MGTQSFDRWVRGKFITLYAKMDLRIGKSRKDGIDLKVYKGDEIEFDGTVIRYAGYEITSPSIRTSIQDGWFTSDPNQIDSHVSPKKTMRNMASNNVKTTDLSRVHRMGTTSLEPSEVDEEVVMDVRSRRDAMQNGRYLTQNDAKKQNVHPAAAHVGGFKLESGDGGDDDGKVVGTVRTPNKLKVDNINEVGNLAHRIEEAQIGSPNFVDTHTEGVMIRHTPRVNRNVVQEDDSGVHVATIKNNHGGVREYAGGITVTDTSNIINERAGRSRNAGPVARPVEKRPPNGYYVNNEEESHEDQEDFEGTEEDFDGDGEIFHDVETRLPNKINRQQVNSARPVSNFVTSNPNSKHGVKSLSKMPKVPNGQKNHNTSTNGKPKLDPTRLASLDPRVRIALRIDPDFPIDWDFTGKLSERLKRVNDHGPSSQFIQALYAAEGDQMRKVLSKEFPDLI